MKKFNQTKKALLLSLLVLMVCFGMFLGTTYAWFTDSVSSAGNVIQTGNLDIEVQYTLDGENWKDLDGANDLFQKSLWEPGHAEVIALKVENKGSLSLKYQAKMNVTKEVIGKNKEGQDIKLSNLLQFSTVTQQADIIGDILLKLAFGNRGSASSTDLRQFTLQTVLNESELGVDAAHYIIIRVEMPSTIGNEANAKDKESVPSIEFGIDVLAKQFTAESDSFGNDYDKDAEYPTMTDTWDGTADTSWYTGDSGINEYTIESAEELAGLSKLINDLGTQTISEDSDLLDALNSKTFTLGCDIDLSGQNFVPIGGVDKGVAFEGVFDGGGHTIYGLSQNGWDLGYSYGQTAGMGLFGWIGNATIKNLNIDSAEISMEAVVMGTVAGYAGGDCTFENITIKNSQIANYNWDTGGIVGQVYGSGSTFVFKNINIDNTNTISGHWGTWDVSAGGVIGRTADGTKVEMEDVYVACVLDVYNDACAAYQWFAYRYSGMLVGYTKTTETVDGRTVATADHVTCKNVTVEYGDWMNYTYCQPSNVSPQYVRVQGGYSTDPYYSGRHWTAGVDAAGNKMVDDNHVHAEGQAHNVVLAFDQLFGGGQGVYGTSTHEGVTVIYPASYSKNN